jgi:hypothetical protein
MKFLTILTFLGFVILDCASQSIIKTYYGKDSSEFIEFIDNKNIRFLFHEDGGFGGLYYAGQGLYRLHKHRLIVKVLGHDKSLESTYRIIKDSTINSGYIIKGQVFDQEGNPLSGLTLSYKIGRKFDGVMTDNNGYFYKEIATPKISDILVTFIGYTQCVIHPIFSKFVEYQIFMKDPYYYFPDNKTLKLKLHFDDNSQRFTIKNIKINK